MGIGSKVKGLLRHCTGQVCERWKGGPFRRRARLVSLIALRNPTAVARQSASPSELGASPKGLYRGLIVLTLVWIGPILACGSFQPRPTPTREPPAPAAPAAETPVPVQPTPTVQSTQVPIPTATLVPPPTPTVVVLNPLTIGRTSPSHRHRRTQYA